MRSAYLLILLLISPCLLAQDTGLFTGSEKLDSCLVDLPLDYAKRNEERLQAAAQALAGIELIYLTNNKKTGTTFQRVFVATMRTPDGSTFVFLESPADHKRASGAKSAMFIKYEPKKQRFYRASCFDAVVANDDALKTLLKEE